MAHAAVAATTSHTPVNWAIYTGVRLPARAEGWTSSELVEAFTFVGLVTFPHHRPGWTD
jgi:hypothetical protein